MTMMPVIQTHTNRAFNFVDPKPHQVCIEDIAHALSHLGRYTGHSRFFYSVAQHSVLVSYLAPKAFAFEALMHDATEAYIGDISSPLKQLLLDYKRIEARCDKVVRERFGLPVSHSPCVKRADMHALAIERTCLLPAEPFCAWEWLDEMNFDVTDWSISQQHPNTVKKVFMERYNELRTFTHE